MSKIVFEDNYVIVVPSFKDVVAHKHNFLHMFLLDESGSGCCDSIYIVGENVKHKMPPIQKCRMFLMIDPTSSLAEELRDKYLIDNKCIVTGCESELLIFPKDNCMDEHSLKEYVKMLLKSLKLIDENNKSIETDDYRVARLIKDIKEYKYLEDSIKEIAREYNLSDSRLSHAFKKCIGVSLKGYLNIKQMEYAYKLVMRGKSITYAATEAGFSSSAHLASVCKKQMGISISSVLM